MENLQLSLIMMKSETLKLKRGEKKIRVAVFFLFLTVKGVV